MALGFTASAAASILEPLEAIETSRAVAGAAAGGEKVISGTGGELLVAQAREAGVEYLFTNPGSYEVGFFDAVVDDSQIQLIEALHEGLAISMADGYHKVGKKPAFVNVHSIAGTAQMADQLYNASRDGSAIVVTAGSTITKSGATKFVWVRALDSTRRRSTGNSRKFHGRRAKAPVFHSCSGVHLR
jgi:Thiamine pyrophosphate enzyme, N-terminal TPP binding domain